MASEPTVELVEVRTSDDIRHAGAFAAARTGAATPRFDAALMMHGAAGTFSDPFYRNFSAALVERGVATLRANNRGHDVINRGNGRGAMLGLALETVEDCILDWQAWLGWLEARGFRRILLFGHSLGAVKTAYFLATARDPRVHGCVLASPPRFNTERLLASAEYGREFARTIAEAEELVAAGMPAELIPTTFPLRSYSSAQAYLAKYTRGAAFDVFAHVADIPCPVLALTGELELDDPVFRDHPAEYAAARERKPDLEFTVVTGGDHFYTQAQTFAVERLLAWL
ncbi:MAG TPA: alpha/beta fold hydrolase [Candidatus Lustribacter sp.]|jgi:pimeloyl-ACP methyl ester carboxylesterase|nr:alpha/beta fold hydrolase [Candidatus Lustribacter sp.]